MKTKAFFKRAATTILLSSTLLFTACDQIKDPVRIESGLLAGVPGSDPAVRVYKGIPFAAPPVGDLRWRAPQPVESWEGVKNADTFGDACVQALNRSRLPWTEEFMHQGDASEDCLYLNVWTTAGTTAEKHPVMVYFYGGGFSEGSNAIAVYDGEELARKGVVLVSVNYRVGAMGFFSHPELSAESEHEASGNYGLLDQVAALEWIKNNIVVFGGDPNNVTIFGQSAGAISVELLMQSPLASGLFHRAIPQSGPGLIPPGMLSGGVRLLEAEAAGMVLADSLGAESLSALRTIAAERFLLPGLGRLGPITDGWFLPENNEHNAGVPVMIGFTANDIGAGTFGPPPENSVIGWEHEAQRLYGEFAGEFLTLYPADSDDVVAEVRQTSSRDRSRVSLSLWAAEQAKKSSAIYTYYFDRAIPWPEHPEFGAFHTGEIPYVFNNLAKLDRPWEGIDSTVADQVSSYWVNFATAGDPSGPDLAEWPPFSAETHVTMELGETMGPMPLADPAKVDFWLSFLTQ